ncbi:MAG: exo-alpha-sialidase [Verrucomicrobia bacterium]|nr:exo-alpha-sialidase [Verrucomicrobiota bacterium]
MLIPTTPLSRPGTKSWANEFRPAGSVLSLLAGFIPVATIIGIICFRGVLDAPDASAKKQVRFSALDELSRSIHADPVNSQFEGCFINVSGQLPCNHGGSLAELPDGSLVCSWYAASSEAAPDARIFSSRLVRGSRTWTEPEVIVGPQTPIQGHWLANKSVGDTVLFLDHEQCLWLFFAGVTIGGWSGAHVDFVVSHDFGRHWSPVQRLIDGFGQSPRSKLLELADGKVMIPLSSWLFHWEGYTVCLNLRDGQVIKKSIAAKIPGPENSQPTLVTLSNGEVVAYLRNPHGGSVLFSRWNPGLNQWSPAKSINLPSPDSAVDAIACEDGVLVVHTSDRFHRFAMSVAWSADGEHFSQVTSLGDRADVSVSYPTVIQSSDGDYHLIYTYAGRSRIKYLHLPQQWVHAEIAKVRDASAIAGNDYR